MESKTHVVNHALTELSEVQIKSVAGGADYHCGYMGDWDGTSPIHEGYVEDF